MSPSVTAILKECFGGSNPSTTSSRSYVNLMSAALLRIGHIEVKIWVGQWLLFQEEGVENLVCHLVFACFFVPLASFYFGLMPHDQSHLRKIQMLQLPEIHCTNSCLNTNFHSGLLHEEKKGILVKQTLAHICFLFISLPMPWALAGTHYILASSRIWKSPTQRKDFYREERKPPQRMHSFCKGKIS